jgi:hypothetical protein
MSGASLESSGVNITIEAFMQIIFSYIFWWSNLPRATNANNQAGTHAFSTFSWQSIGDEHGEG